MPPHRTAAPSRYRSLTSCVLPSGRSLLATAVLAAGCLAMAASAAGTELSPRLKQVLGRGEVAGDLPVDAACVLAGERSEGGPLRCILQVVVDLDAGAPAGEELRLSLAMTRWDGEAPDVTVRMVRPGDLGNATAWVLLAPVELPAANRDLALVLEEVAGERWGGTPVSIESEPLEVPPEAQITELTDLLPANPPATTATVAGTTSQGSPTTTGRASAIRLVPPRERPVEGSARFDLILSDPEVKRVVFFLDGQQVEEDTHPPFEARLQLGHPAREHTVHAVAYAKDGFQLGEDTLVVNRRDQPFRIAFTELSGNPAEGAVEVTAEVSVPSGASLDRVEIYRNDELITTLSQAPFKARIPTPSPDPGDYVRAAAFLSDGSSIDTVELLATPGIAESLQVSLQQLFVVVTDTAGRPVKDLQKDDFEILFRGRPQAVESFSFADDVDLLLGLIIDSSGSMEGIMLETKQAAGQFLSATLKPRDQAFVVDFDTQPRLAQAATSDLVELTKAFRRIVPGGFTAIYDSILFALIQLGDDPGRKALVLLTDGDDYQSRFSPKRAIQDARRSGVPVYIIALGDERQLQRTYKQSDLKDVTEKTGGRTFLVSDPSQLGAAYQQINEELRAQYLLSFATDHDLSEEDRAAIEVRAKRPGLVVRTVVGAQ